MAAISNYARKLILDFSLNTQTATRPTNWGVGLSFGSPTSVSGSEIGTATSFNYSRLTGAAPFGPASTGGSAFNTLAFTFGPVASACSISGIDIWDTVAGSTPDIGNLLWYGLLAAPRTLASGDSLVIATSALTVTLS